MEAAAHGLGRVRCCLENQRINIYDHGSFSTQEPQADEQHEHPVDSVHEQPWTPVHERERTSTVQDLVDTLREQMQLMRDELQAAREERALLLQMLQDMQHRYDRLLDMPHTPPVSPQEALEATQPPPPSPQTPRQAHPRQQPPQSRSGDPRGEMRRRIVALLQEYPEGLTTGELRELVGVDHSLADTCLGMLRYGLLTRLERGTYTAAQPSHHEG